MEWNTTEPPRDHRIMVETQEGSWLYATYIDGQWWDDSGAPIRSPIVRWAEVVSPDETAQ